MKYSIHFGTLLFITVALGLSFSGSVSADSFNQNRIIDDSVFDNANIMNAGQIDNWLNNAFGSGVSCISTSHGFSAPDPIGYSPSSGFSYGGNVSAGQVIYDSAQAYGINPQVLLTTLQKEQSLVTGTAGCSTLQYAAATGYGCPDSGTTYSYSGLNLYSINGTTFTTVSGTCVNTPQKAGFSQQVIRAAWLLKFGEQRSEGNINWAVIKGNWDNSDDPQTCYGGPMTQGTFQRCPSGTTSYYDGYTTIDGTAVHMDDGATASLYWYTPHFSGNQHFFSIFSGWFGSPLGGVSVIQAPGVPGLYVLYGGMKQGIQSPDVETAWGLSGLTPVTMDPAALTALPTRSTILTRLAVNPLSPPSNPAYLLADQGGTFDALSSVVQDWGMSPSSASSIGPELVSFTSRLGSLSGMVGTPGVGGVYLMDNGTLHVMANPTIMSMFGGGSPTVDTLSSALFNMFSTGTAVVNDQLTTSGNYYLADSGGIYTLSGIYGQIYPHSSPLTVSSQLIGIMAKFGTPSRLVSSPSVPGIFLVDNQERLPLGSPSLLRSYLTPGELAANVTKLSAAGLNSFTIGPGITNRFVYNLSTPTNYYYLDHSLNTLSSQFSANTYGIGLSAATIGFLGQTTGSVCDNGFVSGSAGSTGIFLMDGGVKRVITNYPEYQLLNAQPQQECQLPQEDFVAIPGGDVITPLVSNGGTNYLLDGGSRYSISAQIQQDWKLTNFVTIGSGALANYSNGGSLSDSFTMNGSYTFVTDGDYYSTSSSAIASLWANSYTQTHSTYVISYIHNSGALSQFAHSNNPAHQGIYLADQDKFMTIANPDDFFNAGYIGQNIVGVNDAYLTANVLTLPWQGYLASDASSGSIYVLEGGYKHLLPSSLQSNWLGSPQTVTPTSFSSGFLGLLANGDTVTRSFASPDVPGIHAMSNGTRFVIPNGTIYNQSYAPYLKVSSHLIYSIPTT